MFNWFKREINECRGSRCDPHCDGCKLERWNEYDDGLQDHIYKFKKMPANNPDYKTICKAFRATRYPFGDSWNPDILGVYNVVSTNSDLQKDSNERKESMLLYVSYQTWTGIDGFITRGLNNENLKPLQRITLNNTSFQATNNHHLVVPSNHCTCVRRSNEVIFVVICEVPGPKEAKVFGQSEMEGRGEHPFEKYKGEYSLDDNCFFKDSMGRGMSRGLFPVKMKCARLKGTQLCDVFSVDKSLVKPAYLVAVRLPYHRY